MRLSLCIPCMNRAYDLKKVMPAMLEAANASPPSEIAVVDYNSTDDLAVFMQSVFKLPKGDGVQMAYRKYTGRNYYHMAHARNLAVRLSTGDYICIMSADIIPAPDYLVEMRRMIGEGAVWIHGEMPALSTLKREEFIEAGGYDERFEFYGPEDRDLDARLRRRGLIPAIQPPRLLSLNRTSNAEKIKNYRLQISKREMGDQMWAIYQDNCRRGDLVANPQGWGAWE